jgi:hypothetical protein
VKVGRCSTYNIYVCEERVLQKKIGGARTPSKGMHNLGFCVLIIIIQSWSIQIKFSLGVCMLIMTSNRQMNAREKMIDGLELLPG